MKINIKNNTGLFHDGDLREIAHKDDEIILTMESAQLVLDWNEDNIPLSKRDTISGKLHILGVDSIKETLLGTEDDPERYLQKFEMREGYENGNIYRFQLKPNKVILIIWWIQYLPEYEESSSYKYEIDAEDVYWENIPTLSDEYWRVLENELELLQQDR